MTSSSSEDADTSMMSPQAAEVGSGEKKKKKKKKKIKEEPVESWDASMTEQVCITLWYLYDYKTGLSLSRMITNN